MAMYVGTPQVCPLPAEARRGCWIPFRARVTGCWGSQHGCWELNSGPLQELHILLTYEMNHLSSPMTSFCIA